MLIQAWVVAGSRCSCSLLTAVQLSSQHWPCAQGMGPDPQHHSERGKSADASCGSCCSGLAVLAGAGWSRVSGGFRAALSTSSAACWAAGSHSFHRPPLCAPGALSIQAHWCPLYRLKSCGNYGLILWLSASQLPPGLNGLLCVCGFGSP
jgi:hypothetical protein